ncbi:MocR-like pyridoxine biosynthesis transcription factor PdxR [Schwartzia sp. (in: firmicutes)]
MLTYSFENTGKIPLYEHLYRCIRDDILAGRLTPGEKLPSKRTLARNLGISTITVENAYGQLTAEGYCRSAPKKGFFVTETLEKMPVQAKPAEVPELPQTEAKAWKIDFTANTMRAEDFPFAIWTRLLRQVVSEASDELLMRSPSGGVLALRQAIADHLRSFRGLVVSPEQIVIGAGTEYLYSLLVKFFGRDKIFCVENPGYDRIRKVYKSNGAVCAAADMDTQGVRLDEVERCGTDILHISPSHHFPTGIIMPVSRRYELLAWANRKPGRCIIEDDYDSEFRMTGRPIPTLMSIDAAGRVIYMNTFSKSLTPTIRISYMVLPANMVKPFFEKVGFYNCTVSNFEQYTLARFIGDGYFEKHINRMRNIYRRRREELLSLLRSSENAKRLSIIERGSGLHFLLRFNTRQSDAEIVERLENMGIHMRPLAAYYEGEHPDAEHIFVLNYSNLDVEKLEQGLFRGIAGCKD